MKYPGPEHPIDIEPAGGTVTVLAGGVPVARSDQALALSEAAYAIVYYVPREDVQMQMLAEGSRQTFCPYKGDATHFDVMAKGQVLENAAWSYEKPYEAVFRIDRYIAFYRDRVVIIAG